MTGFVMSHHAIDQALNMCVEGDENDGPARIVELPQIPDSSYRYWESYCPVCATHEGVMRNDDDPELIEIRDQHNSRHRDAASDGFHE